MAEKNIRIVYDNPLKYNEIYEPYLHPDERIDELLDPVPSDSECGSDNSETSRPGAHDYFPTQFDNKKKPKDTIERCTENNDAAYDDAFEVDSDMSSLESPRDPNTVTDSAIVNPPMNNDVIINMAEVDVDRSVQFSALRRGEMYDEEISAEMSEGEVETETMPLRPNVYSAHQMLYGSMKRTDYNTRWRDDKADLALDRRLDYELSRQKGLLERGLPKAPLATAEYDADAYQMYEMQPIKRAQSEPTTGSHVTEDGLKQDKKTKRKRKKKSGSGLDADTEMDENGNPSSTDDNHRSSNVRSASVDISKDPMPTTYQNRTFTQLSSSYRTPSLSMSRDRDQERLVDGLSGPSRLKKEKKHKKERGNVVLAEDIPGYQGQKDLDSILVYIDGGDAKRAKKNDNNVKKNNDNSTASSVNTSMRKEKKVKNHKNSEQRIDPDTDSNSSDTANIPSHENGSSSSSTSSRKRYDSGRSKQDMDMEMEARITEEFKLVGGKKRGKRGKDYEEDRRPIIRSKTPPPRAHEAPVSNRKVKTSSQERALSPSAFPHLPTDSGASTGRRNSTGNAPSDLQQDLLVPEETGQSSGGISYAKIAASPKPKVTGPTNNGAPTNTKPDNGNNGNGAPNKSDRKNSDSVKRNLESSMDDKPDLVNNDKTADVNKNSKEPTRSRAHESTPEPAVTTDNKNEEDNSSSNKSSNSKYRNNGRDSGSRSSYHWTNKSSARAEEEQTPPVSSSVEFPSLPRLRPMDDARSGASQTAAPRSGPPPPALLSFANAAQQATLKPRAAIAPSMHTAPSPAPHASSKLVSSNSDSDATGASSNLIHSNKNNNIISEPDTIVGNPSKDFSANVQSAHSISVQGPVMKDSIDNPFLEDAMNKAVVFLDDETYTPLDLGITFMFDESLDCEPPPELVAALENDPLLAAGKAGISFIAVNETAEHNAQQQQHSPRQPHAKSPQPQHQQQQEIVRNRYQRQQTPPSHHNSPPPQQQLHHHPLPQQQQAPHYHHQEQHFQPQPRSEPEDRPQRPQDEPEMKYDQAPKSHNLPNGLVNPSGKAGYSAEKAKPPREQRDQRAARWSSSSDDERFNIADAVKFLQREWARIQDLKQRGTARIIEYVPDDPQHQ